MPLNDANIFRYNFNSRSNKAWNFQLEFLRGSNIGVGSYDSEFLPPMFFDEISILSDFEEGLPFGKQKASLLNLKIDFGVLQGDFTVLKNWILIGGQVISNEFYPNQWRILSNNGRGASDVTYDVVEFWGCQDVIPEQEYTFKFGETQTFDLKVLSLENYILNKITEFDFDSALSFAVNDIFQFDFFGTNSAGQLVNLIGRNYNVFFKYITTNNIVTILIDKMLIIIDTYLRNWLIQNTSVANTGVIGNTNTFLTNWAFKKQLYDLTTQEGAGLGSNTDIKMISSISDGFVTIGGLCNTNSKDGFYQFKNANDLLNSLCEQFISKLTFKYNRNDTFNSVRLNLNFKAPYDSLAGGSISLGADSIAGEVKLIRGVYAIAESTVSYKAYKQNQNKNTYKVYGSLKQDSFDNKALFTNNVQVGEIKDFYIETVYNLPYIIINQLYYIDTSLYLTHANCSVMLGTETTKTIYNESITGDTIDPADNKSSGNKEINRAKLIEWANVRYNKSGLNYVQSKAYASIMNDKAMLLECEVLDYLIKPRDVGDKIVSDLSTILNLPSEWFFTTNHVLTSCEIDLLTGISKVKLFIRGE